MNRPKVRDQDYIDFLIAAPKVCSAIDAVRAQPAHDACTRLEPDIATRWHEAAEPVERNGRMLVVDNATLDKRYARKIELVQRHGAGEHHAVVEGIKLITLLWPEGDRHVPADSRLYDKRRDRWIRGQIHPHPPRRAGLFGQSTLHVIGNCVTPNEQK